MAVLNVQLPVQRLQEKIVDDHEVDLRWQIHERWHLGFAEIALVCSYLGLSPYQKGSSFPCGAALRLSIDGWLTRFHCGVKYNEFHCPPFSLEYPDPWRHALEYDFFSYGRWASFTWKALNRKALARMPSFQHSQYRREYIRYCLDR